MLTSNMPIIYEISSKKHYTIIQNWNADKFAGIDLDWYHQKRTCHLYIKDYIHRLLL